MTKPSLPLLLYPGNSKKTTGWDSEQSPIDYYNKKENYEYNEMVPAVDELCFSLRLWAALWPVHEVFRGIEKL